MYLLSHRSSRLSVSYLFNALHSCVGLIAWSSARQTGYAQFKDKIRFLPHLFCYGIECIGSRVVLTYFSGVSTKIVRLTLAALKFTTHSHVHFSLTDLFGLRCSKGCVTPTQALCTHQYLNFTTVPTSATDHPGWTGRRRGQERYRNRRLGHALQILYHVFVGSRSLGGPMKLPLHFIHVPLIKPLRSNACTCFGGSTFSGILCWYLC
jgi:hypothetical protein